MDAAARRLSVDQWPFSLPAARSERISFRRFADGGPRSVAAQLVFTASRFRVSSGARLHPDYAARTCLASQPGPHRLQFRREPFALGQAARHVSQSGKPRRKIRRAPGIELKTKTVVPLYLKC